MLSRLIAVDLAGLGRTERGALAVALAVLLAALWVSVGDLAEFGGVDLRARVIGARALLDGIDPYVNGTTLPPVERLDPRGGYPGPSRVTYPPTLLALYGLFSGMPYLTQRWLWGVLEWVGFAATLLVAVRLIPKQRHRAWALAGAMVLFGASHFWRLHVERGQYYIFMALAFAVDALLLLRGSRGAGWSIGVVAALRPTGIVLAPLLWAAGWRRAGAQAAVAAMVVAALSTAISGPQMWGGYVHNVQQWTSVVARDGAVLAEFGPPQVEPPKLVEGANFASELPARTANATVLAVAAALGVPELGWVDKACKGAAAIWLTAVFFWLLVRRDLPARRRLLVCLVATLAVDFLLPIRHGYADILMVPVLALGVPIAVRWEDERRGVLVVTGVVLGALCLPMLEAGLTTLLRSLGLWGLVAACAALPWDGQRDEDAT